MATKNGPRLTDAQLQHVKLIGAGYSPRQIGEIVGVPYETVRARESALRTKLNVFSRTSIAVYALTGWLPNPPPAGSEGEAYWEWDDGE